MFYPIRTHDRNPKGKIFAWLSFLMGIAVCVVSPVFPDFIKTIVHTDSNVSLFYSFLAIVVFLGGVGSSFIFKKFKRTAVTKFCLLLLALVLLMLVFATTFLSMAILVTIKSLMELLLGIVLALFVRDFAKANDLDMQEGRRFKYGNVGAFIGLFIGGFMATQLSYEIVFIAEALVVLFAFVYFYKKHVIDKHPAIIEAKPAKEVSFFRGLKRFFDSKERTKIYFIATAHLIWISFKYLYIPLYVFNTGFLPSMSGLILAIAMIPAIIFETKTSDFGSVYGYRKIISLGFFIVAVLLAIVFISPWPLLNFGLLAVANVGSGFIEPLRESYFMNNTPKEEEEKLYGFYMTSDPVSGFLTPLIGVLSLALFPFKFLFLTFAIVMLGAAYFSWTSLER